jgi:hypothetical protein
MDENIKAFIHKSKHIAGKVKLLESIDELNQLRLKMQK